MARLQRSDLFTLPMDSPTQICLVLAPFFCTINLDYFWLGTYLLFLSVNAL